MCRKPFSLNQLAILIENAMLAAGTLPPVQSLALTVSGSTVTYTWEPPHTLELPERENIEGYKVEVINSITSEKLHSDTVNVTEYSFDVPLMSWCFVPLFTVIAVNVVGDGTPKTKSFVGNYGRT